MPECNDCGRSVSRVWRHRAFGSETHRETEWVCADCHPDLPDTVTIEADSEPSGDRLVTDGGRSYACPSCAGPTINGQGLFSCVDCSWSGSY